MSATAFRRVEIPGSTIETPWVRYLPREGVWETRDAFTYHDGPRALTIPGGFRCDLASVPRRLWWLIAPFELSIAAPLLHDALYRHAGELPDGWCVPLAGYTREQADRLFRDVMKAEGVPAWRRAAAYRAVRWFGGGAWRDRR